MYARDNIAEASYPQQPTVRNSVIEAAALALGMLADPTRLRLMAALLGGERDVTGLTGTVGVARPTVSQHLGKLRLAGLVVVRRDGRRAFYALADQHVRRLVTEAFRAAEQRVPGRPEHHEPAPD